MNTVSTSIDRPSAAANQFPAAHIVPVPVGLVPFSARAGEDSGDWISYASHPAYRELVESSVLKARLASTLVFAKYFSVILCKRLVSYELIPAHLRNSRSVGGALRLLRAAAGNAVRKLRHRTASGAGSTNPVQSTLARDGVAVAKIDSLQLARISTSAQPLFDQLRQRRGDRSEGGRAFDESRSSARRNADAELYAAVELMLHSSGILEGISSYMGRPASLIDVNPQINDKSDDFWRNIFPDLPAADRPAAYFHRDASGGDVKAILYMSDVSPANGPFSYAVGSHRSRSSSLAEWVEETNDQSACAGTGPRNRARFAALPAVLQRKCSVGNDILPGTEIAGRLLGAEWSITAARGHIVLFDTKGLHRGGMVASGERLVLTCVIG